MRRLLLVISVLSMLCACTPQGDPMIPSEGFRDDFEREDLGDVWHNTGGRYRIQDGWLNIQGARNRPLWLRRRLPRDVRIEFDVRSESPQGDIKVEVFGDGSSRATSESYTATSYVVIFGGWNNSLNIIARMDEHADDRAVGPRRPVEPGRTYRMKIERVGDTITAWVDGEELASMTDDEPLYGRGHDHFAFNDWEADLWFDNLEITPL
ncbi:MAG: family 16 glycoside hydrolase [Myxococcota bacterium]|nr:family 16 glycoside hydrolase [Myxococcota bacterium]